MVLSKKGKTGMLQRGGEVNRGGDGGDSRRQRARSQGGRRGRRRRQRCQRERRRESSWDRGRGGVAVGSGGGGGGGGADSRFGRGGRGGVVVLVLLEVERHLPAQSGVPRPPLVLHRLPVHPDGQAALESARAALVAVGLVHQAGALVLRLAHVLAVATDGALGEGNERRNY